MERYPNGFDRRRLNDVIRNNLSCLYSLHVANQALEFDAGMQAQVSIKSESEALIAEYRRELKQTRQDVAAQLPQSIMINGWLEVVDSNGVNGGLEAEGHMFEIEDVDVEMVDEIGRPELFLYLADRPASSESTRYRWRYNDQEWTLPEHES